MTVIPFPISTTEPAALWPKPSPLPSTLPDVPAFAAGMLPAELRPWAEDISDRMQCPIDFIAIPAMVAAGSMIGRRIGIRPESKTDWTEVGNLWGCIVGPPGALKSPAVSEALGPVRRLEAKAASDNEQAAANFAKQCTLHKLHKEGAEQRARKELKDGATELAAAILAEVEEPEAPTDRRYMATDATAEKLGEICAANPMGILVHRDELLTLFADLDREEKATARGFYLSGWGGRDGYTFDRIMRGTVRIPSVNLSLIGTTQPNRISRYMKESFHAHDDGMVQRLQLLAWPDFTGKWESTDRYPNAAAKAEAFECYSRLASLDATQLGAERDPFDDGSGIPYLRFAPEALETFVTWRGELEARVRGTDLSPHFAAHLAKYRGLIPRLALVYHLASGGSGPVSLEACIAALCWSEYLEAHAARAYASVDNIKTSVAEAILQKIRKGALTDGFTARDVYRPQWSGLKDNDAIAAALALLADFDWLQAHKSLTGGRPTETFSINPAVLQ